MFDYFTFLNSIGAAFTLIISVYLTVSIWKWFIEIWIYIFCQEPHLYEPLTTIDQTYIISPGMAITGIYLKTDSLVDINRLRDHFYETFLSEKVKNRFPVFRYIPAIILGYAYKKPIPVEKIDLTYHIREEQCGQGENEMEVLQSVHEDLSRMKDWSTPNWEIVLVKFPHEQRTTVIFKIDHWLADGTIVRCLIDILTENKTDYSIPEPGKPLTWKGKIAVACKAPYGLWTYVKDSYEANWNINPWIALSEKEKRKGQIKYAFNQSTSILEFQKLRQACRLANAKMQSIFISLHVSTMRKLVKNLGKHDGKFVPKDIPIIFPMPAPSHPLLYKQKWSNWAKAEFLSAPLNETDILKQLKIINQRLLKYEDCEGALIICCILNFLTPLLPYKVFAFFFSRGLEKQEHYVTVNPFIFSKNPYHLLGAKVLNLNCIAVVETDIKFGRGGIALFPITVGNNAVHLSIRGPSTLFETQWEADMYLKIYSEELDLLLKMLRKQDETS